MLLYIVLNFTLKCKFSSIYWREHYSRLLCKLFQSSAVVFTYGQFRPMRNPTPSGTEQGKEVLFFFLGVQKQNDQLYEERNTHRETHTHTHTHTNFYFESDVFIF